MPHLSQYADELEALARAPVRLGSRNPERPHEDLSDLRHAMQKLAGRIRAGAPSTADVPAARPSAFAPGVHRTFTAEIRRRRVA
jgi:hypothetical protein